MEVVDVTGWSGTSVLVTGATGMVGGNLTRRLLDAGARVVVLVRDGDPSSQLLREGLLQRCQVVEGDLLDARTVERSVNHHEVDTVFHLGAQTIVGSGHRAPVETFEANIQGTWNVLDAARRLSGLVKRVVVASSDKAYGTSDDLPYREDMPLLGRAPYEVSKSCADLITQCYASTYSVPTAIARCGNIYGPGDLNWSRIVPGTIRSLLRDECPVLRSDGTFLRDYMFVEDVVDAYLLLAESLEDPVMHGEAFNFSDEAPLSVLEIYRAVCAAVGADVEPVIEDRAVGEIKDQYLAADKARERLGWRPAWNLRTGLEETVSWYRGLLTPAAV